MEEGTFIHQSKYTRDLLKKYSFGGDLKPQSTPMSSAGGLDKDEDGVAVDQKEYRGMIGSLLYLMATRPDILFATRLCARYQVSPRESHLKAVKRIFMYITYTPEHGLFYATSSSLQLVVFLMLTMRAVSWIANPLWARVNFSVHLLSPGLPVSKLG